MNRYDLRTFGGPRQSDDPAVVGAAVGALGCTAGYLEFLGSSRGTTYSDGTPDMEHRYEGAGGRTVTINAYADGDISAGFVYPPDEVLA